MLDGLSATIMDESLLRSEPLLWRYWTAVSWLSYKESRAAVSSRKSTLQVHHACVHGSAVMVFVLLLTNISASFIPQSVGSVPQQNMVSGSVAFTLSPCVACNPYTV